MFSVEKDKDEINMMNPLIWAYIGDSIYEVYIKKSFIEETEYKPHKLHILTSNRVNAKSQAKTLDSIEVYLTDEEKDIVRRGRNAKNYHLPKNTTIEEYAKSTAFEGLIGYLYLTKEFDRLKELFNLIEAVKNKEKIEKIEKTEEIEEIEEIVKKENN